MLRTTFLLDIYITFTILSSIACCNTALNENSSLSYGGSPVIWDHSLTTCHPTQVNAPHINPGSKLVLDLATPEGWKLSWPRLPANAPTRSQNQCFGHESDAL